ncbi:MFS transporter [Nocardia sp. NPDC051030]|uniref:MFS transporter n=1 Tax=Nocardia sp. NPDC051030 TaxID=3155162 RepID=UPI00343B7D5E
MAQPIPNGLSPNADDTAPERNPRRWWILIVLCLSTLVLVVDNMALSVAVPSLARDLDASAQDLQWILDSYILVFAGLLLTSGSLGDRYGRRKIMLIGLAVFGVASLVGTLATNPAELIGARVAMGIGGALIMPSTLSILITVFEEDERRKAMSLWGAVCMLGLIGSPILGGTLIAHFWWGSIFLINVPVAALAIVAALMLMPESTGPWQQPDPLGAVLSVVGMTALVWTIIEMPREGLSGRTLTGLVVTVVALAGFVVWEMRTPYPMVPLKLFRNRDFSGGSMSLTLVQVGNGGLLLALTQYLQFVLGYSPLRAGMAFIPMAVASLVFNGVGAGLGPKIGNRVLAVLGLTIMAAGSLLLAQLEADSGFGPVALALVAFGMGSSLAMPAAISAIMGAVPPEQAGVGSALNDTIQQAGAALGVAILGSILTSRFTEAMPDGTPEAANASIGDALNVAASTGDSALIGTAREAFATAMHGSFLAGAAGIAAAAVLALVTLRGHQPAPDEAEHVEGVEPEEGELVEAGYRR